MAYRTIWIAGVCTLALCVAAPGAPRKRAISLKCAAPAEVTAMQTAAIQQELMDAALVCGDTARDNYNAFQTRFSKELQASDKLMLRMFGRVLGNRSGDKAYNLFKTEMAAKAELRRTHNHDDFCQDANLVVAAALGPSKISLADFVADVPATDMSGGVDGCSIQVAVTLKGAMAVPNIVPKPNPLRLTAPEPATAVTPVPAAATP
jgi:hypothetical protein